jgi:hypothetical protein
LHEYARLWTRLNDNAAVVRDREEGVWLRLLCDATRTQEISRHYGLTRPPEYKFAWPWHGLELRGKDAEYVPFFFIFFLFFLGGGGSMQPPSL